MVFSVEKWTLVVFLDFVFLGGFFGPKVDLGGFFPKLNHKGSRSIERRRIRLRQKGDGGGTRCIHTHTHTHTQRERERERVRRT